jgi:hypothetical protein
MKRGPQPKRVFDATQSRARAAKIRELMGVMPNSKMRAGMELLARKFEERADKLEAQGQMPELGSGTMPQAH